jgi:DNA-binding MarR family transcriptional regulator
MTTESAKALLIVKSLLGLGSALHRNGDKITGEYGLNQQQFVVLSEIVDRGPINQKQLVGGLLIEKSNLSKIVKKLKTLGLIKISSSPNDGRATLLSVTKKGKTVWERCMEKFNEWQVDWVNPLTKDEMAQTIKVLDRLKGLPL